MVRKPKAPMSGKASGFGEERQAPFEAPPGLGEPASPGAMKRERRLLKLGPDGRVLIPADWRQAMELKENDTLVAYLEDGELKLHGSQVGVRKTQALARKLLRPGPSLVDELIADRREEARREDQDG